MRCATAGLMRPRVKGAPAGLSIVESVALVVVDLGDDVWALAAKILPKLWTRRFLRVRGKTLTVFFFMLTPPPHVRLES